MSLEKYYSDMNACSRCSACKWVPYNEQKSWRFAKNCPSICNYNFQAYSGSGRMIIANSLVQKRSELTDTVADIVYRCQFCGACDVGCKAYRDDIDISDVMLELRGHCVEQGFLIPEHMAIIESMKKEDNTLGEKKAERGNWAEGLGLKDINKEKVDVLFHAGCRFSYDLDLRDTVRKAAMLLLKAGVDVGIAGKDEACCGGRVYEMGYFGEAGNFADDMISRVKASGAKTIVTPCADCFACFRFSYGKMGKDLGVEVLHISQYIERLIKEGKLKLTRKNPLLVTYHDPCHLGRMSEPYMGDFAGRKKERPMTQKRAGWNGVYATPRNIIKALPGVELTEMERIKEWSWCCGAGGGVIDAYPEFAASTATERLDEALSTSAEALVTSCPWCERLFKDTVNENNTKIEIFDLMDLVHLAAE